MLLALLLLLLLSTAECLKFSVAESAKLGHVIGFIAGHAEVSTTPTYFVVFPDEQISKFLKVDEKSGEISTIATLDYEKRARFDFVAVRVADNADTIDITIEVIDENDNSPIFADQHVKLKISEFAQIGATFALPSVIDGDGPQYTVQRFEILQGNVNNVFRVATRRDDDNTDATQPKQADLVVNGQLDREFRDSYELLIEARDGGDKRGQLRVSIAILDANDMAPIFAQTRYSATVAANITAGAKICQVRATDGDVGDNARVSYEIRKTAAPSNSLFQISPDTGVISATAPLLAASTHDLIVVARDHGSPPLSTSTVVTITVLGSTLSAPPLDVIWLVESNSAHLMENATLGSIVARVSVAREYRDTTRLKLTGCNALCPQQTDISHVYLLLLCGVLDRETQPEYQLKFMLENDDGRIVVEHPQLLTIGDINDNYPHWHTSQIHISLNRTSRDGGGSRTLIATDADAGANGWIKYTILDTDRVAIDAETGRVYVRGDIGCEVGAELRFRVRAEDGGQPALFSDLQVIADLVDAESRPPQFEQSMWQVEVAEDVPIGTCLVKVVANSSQCGNSKRIRYSMRDPKLSIDSISGTVCLIEKLDYEQSTTYQATVIATNSNAETSTSLISIILKDVNDNWPIFYPSEYQLTLREGQSTAGALLVVSATDADPFGKIAYHLLSDSTTFSINSSSGEIAARTPLTLGKYHLIVGAKDGAGLTAEHAANVHINVIEASASVPQFSKSRYEIRTTEDILPGIAIGSVAVMSPDTAKIRYSIYSGDPHNYFSIDELSGRIYVQRYLDADVEDRIVLNVQAKLDGGVSNQTQVIIHIEDHNDNPPIFANDVVEIFVKEDQPINQPFYMIRAVDKDQRNNGEVVYTLISSHPSGGVNIDATSGRISTSLPFDYETTRDFKVRFKASDRGIPPKSSNMTLFIHIVDVNDNSPRFGDEPQHMEVVEMSAAKTIIGRVVATDRDAGRNGEIAYRVTNGSEYFGVDERLGDVYTKRAIDREVMSFVDVTIVAEDRGEPRRRQTAKSWRVQVADVNDNAPSCATISPIVVAVDAPPSMCIGTIVATDPDRGLNGSVLYRSQLESPLFIVKANGDVYLRRALNSTATDSHQRLSVIVSDQGTPRKSAVCHVDIRVTVASSSSAIVLHEPVERFIEIGEQCAKHTCRLTAFNASGVHTWQIQSSEIANHFQLRDGVLTMLSWPTSHRPPYTLTIIMSDEMGRQKSLQLRMTSTQDAAGREQIVRINESTSVGTRVGRLGEKDPATFYTTSNSTCPLEVDQTSGQLYLAAHATTSQKCAFVRVNTTDGVEIAMDVQIEVTKSRNSRDAPRFDTDHFAIDVAEDLPVGSVFWSAMTNLTQDAEQEMEAISWRFAVANEKFAIDQFTGDVSLLEPLHWHEKSTYNFAIEAFTRRTTSILLTINIKDVDDHPPKIISSSDLYLPSILRKGSKVHRVIAHDIDDQSSIRYKLKTISKLLKINETSGEMLIRSSDVDAEKSCVVIAESSGKIVEQVITIHPSTLNHSWHYFDDQKMTTHSTSFDLPTSSVEHVKLSVISPEVYDLNGLKIHTNTSTTMTILAESTDDIDYTVVNVDLPTPLDFEPLKIASTSCGVVSVRENIPVATLRRVMVQGARSPNFRFQGGVEKEFRINATSGMIGLEGSLDREIRQEHLLVVMVEDRGRTDSCTVRIIVTDINDNTPQFHPSTPDLLTISLSTNIGDVLHTFDATDADISLNGKLTYDLIRDESQSLDLIPETGSLVYRRRSPLAEWTITCRVSDQGAPKLHKDIDIRIVNIAANLSRSDELAFLKQSYVSSVDESLPRGQFVGKIAVVPEDVGITYSIVEGNVDSAFAIDSDGVIRTNLELDKEIVDKYNLRIIGIPVGQQQRHQISTRFDIRVNNLNDNAPFFSATLPRKISESTPCGTYIATIQAKDVDQLDALQYSIEGDDADQMLFEIDMFSGNIHLVKPLDFEKATRHVLRIRATDGEFAAHTNLTINVIDANDNAPTFAKPVFNVRTDSLIDVDCRASDADTQTTLHYTIQPDDVATIGATTGMVRMRMLPPIGERHVVKVTASDGKFKSSVPLIIATTSVPESRVEVESVVSREFRVAEDSDIGTLVGSLVESFNDEETYLGGPDDFEIDRFGRIYIVKPLEASLINFESVTETGRRFNVTIHVEDVNNDAPQFTQSIYSIALKDSMQHGQVIGKVVANDDASDTVTYHILSGNDYNVITLSQSTGNVIFNEWNDATPLRIFIEARDSAANTAIATISLNLKYSTATAPFFVLPAYDVHVLEGVPIGTVIWRARASNRLGDATATNLMYSLKEVSANEFAIDLMSGEVRNKIHLDWESQTVYEMQLAVADGNGRSAVVPLRIHVEPRDEFAPVFATPSRQMTFRVATTAAIGDVVGEVRAVDEDAGVHGVVRYSIVDRQTTVRIDDRGNIILLKNLANRKNVTMEKFDIVAYSSQQRQTRATVYLEIGDFATTLNPRLLLHSPTVQIATISLVLLLATLILLLCICMCRARVTSANIAKKSSPPSPPPPIPSVYSVQTGEIRALSGDITTSRLPRHRIHDSMSSSSTSSVLRAGGVANKSHHSQIDSGCDPAGDDESLNSSVTEYLVAMGVNANPIPPRIKTTTTYDSLMNDYIYARVDDVLPPGPINLHTPNQHAMLRREIMTRKPPIIPSFEPLTEIFNEICDQQHKEFVQVEI